MVERNFMKYRDGIFDYNQAIEFTRKPFGFYGAYVRMEEH